jgi:hypothetical protein
MFSTAINTKQNAQAHRRPLGVALATLDAFLVAWQRRKEFHILWIHLKGSVISHDGLIDCSSDRCVKCVMNHEDEYHECVFNASHETHTRSYDPSGNIIGARDGHNDFGQKKARTTRYGLTLDRRKRE